jgi:hypothetical protein
MAKLIADVDAIRHSIHMADQKVSTQLKEPGISFNRALEGAKFQAKLAKADEAMRELSLLLSPPPVVRTATCDELMEQGYL